MSPDPPPLRPEEGKSVWLLLRHEAELRDRLQRMCAGLADPALARVIDGLARPDGVRERIGALNLALEESLRELTSLHAELTRPEEGSTSDFGHPGSATSQLPHEMAETLRRYLRRHASSRGFRHEIRHDDVRGWVVRWREVADDGSVVASGRIYERPWKWLSASASGSSARP
ncbi:MAG: hypothetical protein EA350_01120 [Gemmatimonadales bacterium]|nr:MAG: hypothetical protein EA350_01120 [Gemmatimonadales bacterium]